MTKKVIKIVKMEIFQKSWPAKKISVPPNSALGLRR